MTYIINISWATARSICVYLYLFIYLYIASTTVL